MAWQGPLSATAFSRSCQQQTCPGLPIVCGKHRGASGSVRGLLKPGLRTLLLPPSVLQQALVSRGGEVYAEDLGAGRGQD